MTPEFKDAHFVLCNEHGTPTSAKWQRTKATAAQAVKRRKTGGKIGVVPASLGLVGIDVDSGGVEALEELKTIFGCTAENSLALPSKTEGRWHLYVNADESWPSGNAKWESMAGAGDIRYDRGFLVLHGDGAARMQRWCQEAREPSAAGLGLRQAQELGVGMDLAEGWQKGHRNDTLNRRVYAAALRGDSLDEVVAEAKQAGLTQLEIARTVASAVEGADATEQPKLVGSKDAAGLAEALEDSNLELRHNELADRDEVRVRGQEWTNMTDRLDDDLREGVAMRYRYKTKRGLMDLRFGPDAWRTAITHIANRNPHNPALEWLRGIGRPQRREDAIMEAFRRSFTFEDGQYARWIVRAMFIGVIERALEPGCPIRVMPVMIGPQSCGKSTWVREMLPAELQEYYQPELPLAQENVEKVSMMQGMLIAECAELHGASRADVNAIKAWLGPGKDHIRLKYGRRAETVKRTAHIIGTANPGDSLPSDPTGNTRFAVLEVGDGPEEVQKVLPEMRDECWRSALALYNAGERASFLPNEFRNEQTSVNRSYDPVDENVANKLAQMPPYQGLASLRALAEHCDVVNAYGDFPTPARRNEFSRALTREGFTKVRKRVRGQQIRLWGHPDGDHSDDAVHETLDFLEEN